MDKVLIEIIKIIAPVVITGLITFLITKYNYSKSRPLDKMELAYNRVYYPIYRLLKREKQINQELVDQCEKYINKYEKYVDWSTLATFDYLKKNVNNDYVKDNAYFNFKNNINNRNSFLRKRLGYLEVHVFDSYKYAPQSQKLMIRLCIEALGLYIPTVIASSIKNELLRNIFAIIFLVSAVAILTELIIGLFNRIVIFVRIQIHKNRGRNSQQ